MIRSIPAGWHTITPRIVARDAAKLVEFIKEVFEARGDFRADVPSEIEIGDSRIMISGEGPRDAMPAFSVCLRRQCRLDLPAGAGGWRSVARRATGSPLRRSARNGEKIAGATSGEIATRIS